MNKINILWVDDEWELMSSFIDECAWPENGINIIPFKYAIAAMEYFEENIKDISGVILDAKCLLETDNEVAKLKGLAYCVKKIEQLSSKRKVPYYIFTGQPDLKSDESFKDTYEKYYSKGDDDETLIADIKQEAEKLEETQICFKYVDVIDVIPEAKQKLVSLLLALEHGVTNDPDLLSKSRKIIELIENHCYDHGVCPFKLGMENINEFSRFMGEPEMKDFVPTYIQETIRYCVRILNPTAHALELDHEVEKDNYPYVIRSIAYSILNLLTWCKSLPQSEEDILIAQLRTQKIQDERKAKLQTAIIPEAKEEYEGLSILIEKDEEGNLHGGKCMISSKLINKIGKKATIVNVVENTNPRSKDLYPFFGKLKD